MPKAFLPGRTLFNPTTLGKLYLLPDDVRWLKKILKGVPGDETKALLDEYANVWLEHFDKEPLGHIKHNSGRHAANSFIRVALNGHLS